jgi:inorganic pyrophosphatase
MIDIDKISYGKEAPEIVNVIIEIPMNSNNKYELDKKTGLLILDRPLYSAVHYPGDYGFIPQTFWEDGDPLDILVLTSKPVYPLTLAKVRVIGTLIMEDSGEKDNKIIGVYESDPHSKGIIDIKQVHEHKIKEIVHFFETYKELQGKKCKIHEIKGREDAYEDINKAIADYKKRKSSS